VLEQLTIRNFAIIDRLEIGWRPGLNVITGETGAGKSIVVDAVGALLGDRLGAEVVRTGAERAVVEGVFVLPPETPPDLAAVLDEFGLEAEDGVLIVTREIAAAGGRGGARVNGRAVPLAVLQQLGEQLVDIHGQSAHMALLRAREQLDYLDRYAGVLAERAAVGGLVRELRAVRDAQHALQGEQREAARQEEMLRHEVAEIERAELREDEEEELLAQRSRLQHVERLRQAATAAYEALTGAEAADRDMPGAVSLLGEAVAACADGARFDPALGADPLGNLNGALAQADEATRALRDYLDTIEADPESLERTQERLFVIGDLKRKYGATIRQILGYAVAARERLDGFAHRSERLAELEGDEARLVTELGGAAGSLSLRRQEVGAALAAAVQQELGDLRMQGTRFSVAVSQTPRADGVPVDGCTVAFDGTGVDAVEFLIAANPGEDPRPMARVASGGELARLALALKTILSRADTRPTLIFDEVDVGVGGRTGPVVGQKLWAVAAGEHQVLCVTHMPQVAAFADYHYVIAKETTGGRTHSLVTMLDVPERVEELAAMLAGSVSASSRQSAGELLDRAAAFKGASYQPTNHQPSAIRGVSNQPSAVSTHPADWPAAPGSDTAVRSDS